MRSLLKFLRPQRTGDIPQHNLQSPQWKALEAAIQARDFQGVADCLAPWSTLTESKLEDLREAARAASFSEAENEKLTIFYWKTRKINGEAFVRAQSYLNEFGFDPDLHVLCLELLWDNGQFEDALTCLGVLTPDQAENMKRSDYWEISTEIRRSANAIDTLQAAADRALALAPKDGSTLPYLLATYIELGLPDKVIEVRALIESRPFTDKWTFGQCLLALGEKEAGWALMESRYETHANYFNAGLKAQQLWGGQSLLNKRILVSCEQGLGDTIQYARYFPRLTESCAQVFLETHLETLALLQYNFPDIPMVERQFGTAPAFDFEFWTGAMSLPRHLQNWSEMPPGREGYLRVPPDSEEYWKERVSNASTKGRVNVGLAWSGNPQHKSDRRRSIPFELMERYVRGNSATFFALQTKVPDVLPDNLVNLSEEMITLADTAALIEEMDIVITVDTSVVHLAGALGKKTLLLLPKRYEWRWGLEGESNDWYDSVTVIRQVEHANWQQVLDDVFERRLPAELMKMGF